jgi:hypothetical protein
LTSRTLYRRSQGEGDASTWSALHDQFSCELDALIDDLRAECVAELGGAE